MTQICTPKKAFQAMIMALLLVGFISQAMAADLREAATETLVTTLSERGGSEKAKQAIDNGRLAYNGDQIFEINPTMDYLIDGTLAKNEQGETLPFEKAMAAMLETEKVLADQAWFLVNGPYASLLTQQQLEMLRHNSDRKMIILDRGLATKLKNLTQENINLAQVSAADLNKVITWFEGNGPVTYDVTFGEANLDTGFLNLPNGVILARYTYESKRWQAKVKGNNVLVAIVPDPQDLSRSYVMKSRGYTELREITTLDTATGKVKVTLRVGDLEKSISKEEVKNFLAGNMAKMLRLMFDRQGELRGVAEEANAAK